MDVASQSRDRTFGGSKITKSKREVPTIQDAKAIAHRLIKAFPGIAGVLLCGSVARGDADEWSDTDLVVIGSDPNLTSERLRKALPRRNDRISLIYYPTSIFKELYRERALFIAHLKQEGVILYDPRDLFKTIFSQPVLPISDIAEQVKAQRDKLAPYTDPRRFNNNFLFCLSHLYSIGKGIILLGLAKRGVLEFNREAAFRRFAGLNPDLVKETKRVAQLRPFYRLVTGRRPEPLPFSYRSAGRQMQAAVSAIQTLAERVEGQ
jgi:predicted nucleotidyltransferase